MFFDYWEICGNKLGNKKENKKKKKSNAYIKRYLLNNIYLNKK